jgi:hypothetical protein
VVVGGLDSELQIGVHFALDTMAHRTQAPEISGILDGEKISLCWVIMLIVCVSSRSQCFCELEMYSNCFAFSTRK